MANKGYTDIASVQLYLARTLTTDQQTQATTNIGVAETLIDRETRRAWLVPPITAERYDIDRPAITLRYRPITSVQLIQTRSSRVGDTLYTCVAGIDYEVLDLGRGEIHFGGGVHGRDTVGFISYTPNRPVPADISRCATLIVAHSLLPAIFPDRVGVEKAQVDAQTSIQYDVDGYSIEVPESAQKIIDGYKRPLLGFY